MLRNKIGKAPQTGSTTDSNKTNETKTQNPSITNASGIKTIGAIGSNIGGIKAPTFIGVKSMVKPSTIIPQANQTQSQSHVSSLSNDQTPNLSQQKSRLTRPQQIKTEQQRLAELVNKKAAQMKKQYQMINKISSQIGNDKKSYFKQYQTQYGHVLKISNKKIIQNRENCQKQPKKIEKQNVQTLQQTKTSRIVWSINEWDRKDQLKQHLLQNFKAGTYL